MKRKWIKRTIGIITAAAVIVSFVHVMQNLVANDGRSEGIILQGYYLEEKNSLDMVIMGASEVMNGYSAAEVYSTNGLTSYPYSFAVNPVSLWKYELWDIERTQHPQVLIIEINGALYREDKYISSDDFDRLLAENMPISDVLLRLVKDKNENLAESMFPFIKYHYKWNEIREEYVKDRWELFKDGYSRLRGTKTPLYRDNYKIEGDYVADETTADLNQNGEDELKAFLEECKKSKIPNIVFVEFPHILNREKAYERHQRANRAGEIIKEAGFDYYDFTKDIEKIGLDTRADFYDTHHMIASGQKKFSQYLGDLMVTNYGITPKKQSEKNKKEWEDSKLVIDKYYTYYNEYMKEHEENQFDEVDLVLMNTKETLDLLDSIN